MSALREIDGHRREVAEVAVNDAEERDDRGLVPGDAGTFSTTKARLRSYV